MAGWSETPLASPGQKVSAAKQGEIVTAIDEREELIVAGVTARGTLSITAVAPSAGDVLSGLGDIRNCFSGSDGLVDGGLFCTGADQQFKDVTRAHPPNAWEVNLLEWALGAADWTVPIGVIHTSQHNDCQQVLDKLIWLQATPTSSTEAGTPEGGGENWEESVDTDPPNWVLEDWDPVRARTFANVESSTGRHYEDWDADPELRPYFGIGGYLISYDHDDGDGHWDTSWVCSIAYYQTLRFDYETGLLPRVPVRVWVVVKIATMHNIPSIPFDFQPEINGTLQGSEFSSDSPHFQRTEAGGVSYDYWVAEIDMDDYGQDTVNQAGDTVVSLRYTSTPFTDDRTAWTDDIGLFMHGWENTSQTAFLVLQFDLDDPLGMRAPQAEGVTVAWDDPLGMEAPEVEGVEVEYNA